MSNEHDNDDEIRESIPCVTVTVAGHEGDSTVAHPKMYCLPVGYHVDPWGGGFSWRGVYIGEGGSCKAWDHAIAREKERRQRAGQSTAADKAAATLAEVIRERDDLLAERNRVAQTLAECDAETVDDLARMYLRLIGDSGSKVARLERSLSDTAAERDALRVALDAERVRFDGELAAVTRERDKLRAKLERVRNVQRWDMEFCHGDSDAMTMRKVEDGEYVEWSDLAAIVGEDGEA